MRPGVNGDIMAGVKCSEELSWVPNDIDTDHKVCCLKILRLQERHERCGWLTDYRQYIDKRN